MKLDIRNDLEKGQQTFSRIMHTVERLQDDEDLLLISSFQPLALLSLLAAEGFSHQSRETASGDWEVLFSRTRETKLTSASSRACSQSPFLSPTAATDSAPEFVEVDMRGADAGESLDRILEALKILPAGAAIRAGTDRRPMSLFAALSERGFKGETEASPSGGFATIIRRA